MFMDTEPALHVRRELERLIADRRFPGIQYLVVDAQKVRFEFCGGVRDINAALPVTPETTFMAASSTKALTAAAVLTLVQDGKVQLDDPLSAYYPAHPYGPKVTIRRLLNQSAGVPNPLPLRWLHLVEEHSGFDEEAALQAAVRRAGKLAFPPGAKYGYSNNS
jgi:CubicO group peptidase (beta-lactamase class C family)